VTESDGDTANVNTELLVRCAQEAASLRDALVNGDPLGSLSQGIGTTLEHLLCDLFRLDASASRYWVDGVLVDSVTLETGVMVIRGPAWCADHERQWKVPTEVTFRFAEEADPRSLSMQLLVGNAAFGTLAAHRGRNVVRRAPQEWLLAFEIERGVARCVSPNASSRKYRTTAG
jgi:hypothetical protein